MTKNSDKLHKKSGNIPLRINPELHEELARHAIQEGRSLNNYLTKLLEECIHPKTFEDRQFVGNVVSGENFDLDSQLVKISGIYYRFLIENAQKINVQKKYVIIEANGNVLTLRELKS
ncbi:toxin-antitoxin system HicB family antitoxin [Leuconostoc palmae]|uniref:toxin-antitoxin system HicB family antitoxin n=1 Tax=Leuconostoc palmae TaxID=501487 RepID=UPI001C7D1CF9|nr:toxin-antitoxin system HicB family antitoxin [Leuconostoc palmae]